MKSVLLFLIAGACWGQTVGPSPSGSGGIPLISPSVANAVVCDNGSGGVADCTSSATIPNGVSVGTHPLTLSATTTPTANATSWLNTPTLANLNTALGVTLAAAPTGGAVGGASNCPTAGQVPFVASAGVLTCDSGLAYAGAGSSGTLTLLGVMNIALGGKIQCTHGANATCGLSTLTAGSVTVSTTAIGTLAAAGGAGYVVSLTEQGCTGTCAGVQVGTVVNATSFVINGASTDNSLVYWEIKYVN